MRSAVIRIVPPMILLVAWGQAVAEDGAIDFNRDIRPILSGRCLTCHGPDESHRTGGLRLDLRDDAIGPADSGERAIVPGSPEQSELLARVSTDDSFMRMPPPETGPALTEAEIRRLRDWINQGAPYARHWSYIQPRRPAVPDLDAMLADVNRPDAQRLKDWPRNPIDHFVLEQWLAPQ
jgi:hypothetical protein